MTFILKLISRREFKVCAFTKMCRQSRTAAVFSICRQQINFKSSGVMTKKELLDEELQATGCTPPTFLSQVILFPQYCYQVTCYHGL